MINVLIRGGHTTAAGDVLRLLINHPDVDSLYITAPGYASRPVTEVHYGLDGETDMRFSSESELPDEIDITFDCTDPLAITLTKQGATEADAVVYGLPEINRKALVRGAMRAITPSPTAASVALALLPLAKNVLLEGQVRADVTLPAAYATDVNVDERTVVDLVAALQPGFAGPVSITVTPGEHPRALMARIEAAVSEGNDRPEQALDEYYDDHNLTHRIGRAPLPNDVVGTSKCLMAVERSGNTVVVSSALDASLKGTAATSVHIMNLLLGLHERVGLALRASGV